MSEEKTTYHPVYCLDCQYIWYVENKEGAERCPRCGSANTNKGKNRKDELK
jgi:ssDNA-binding Zn-finger/Zn-ribbon topoisomerase 1